MDLTQTTHTAVNPNQQSISISTHLSSRSSSSPSSSLPPSTGSSGAFPASQPTPPSRLTRSTSHLPPLPPPPFLQTSLAAESLLRDVRAHQLHECAALHDLLTQARLDTLNPVWGWLCSGPFTVNWRVVKVPGAVRDLLGVVFPGLAKGGRDDLAVLLPLVRLTPFER